MITAASRSRAAQSIGNRLRELRKLRAWSQTDLARRLQLSQSRLSEIERGRFSLTAEEFLDVLRLFNVAVSEFVTAPGASRSQNALVRLGAAHLRDSVSASPAHDVAQPIDVIRDVLVEAESPRLVTALAPVLVQHIDDINFRQLRVAVAKTGFRRRLGWLLDSTLEATQRELIGPLALALPWARRYQRAVLVLGEQRLQPSRRIQERDLLDKDVRSKQTQQQLIATASPISRRWNIVTAIQIEDFVEALRMSRVGD